LPKTGKKRKKERIKWHDMDARDKKKGDQKIAKR